MSARQFPLCSVWEADADATDTLTTFVIVRADGDKRQALVLLGDNKFGGKCFDFQLDWPFCDKCVRVA